MNTPTRIQHTLLAVALAAAYPLAGAAVTAGTAQFIAGDVNVRRADNSLNPLAKGRDVESGQSIVTGPNGRAQVKFTDGGLLSLQPNSEFRIANYADKADPQQDRFLVDFLRGGMRAITGLIGKRNTANYKVTTTTATIGIRGSGFSAGYAEDGSVLVTTELDAIEVCNAGVCIGLAVGESARIFKDQPPVRVATRAPIPTPGPVQEVPAIGNQVNSDGSPLYLPAAPISVQGGLTVHYVEVENFEGTYTNYPNSRGPYDNLVAGFSGNRLSQFSYSNSSSYYDSFSALIAGGSYTYQDTNPAQTISGSLGSVGDSDFVGWGSWGAGLVTNDYGNGETYNYPLTSLHYVVGKPGLESQMPVEMYGTYALSGGTAYSDTLGRGVLTGGSLNVNFYSGYGQGYLELNTKFGEVEENVWSYLYTSGSSIYDDCGAYVSGFFTGANAYRAALVYRQNTNSAGTVSGAAAFTQTGLEPMYPEVPTADFTVAGTYTTGPTYTSSAFPVTNVYTSANFSEGTLTSFSANGINYAATVFGSSGSAGDISTNDFIGWGNWVSGTQTSQYGSPSDFSNVNYIVGQPTVEMPVEGVFNYTPIGSSVTSNYDGTSGTLLSASLTANFTTAKVGASVTTSFNPSAPLVGTDMPINGSSFTNGTSMSGFFVGPNASRAGLSFQGSTFSGVVGFQQQSGSPQ
ncbi:MAG: FecR family protein [Polaromonas sp.]|nr:FecR family protein [Polaromonas sp.]